MILDPDIEDKLTIDFSFGSAASFISLNKKDCLQCCLKIKSPLKENVGIHYIRILINDNNDIEPLSLSHIIKVTVLNDIYIAT